MTSAIDLLKSDLKDDLTPIDCELPGGLEFYTRERTVADDEKISQMAGSVDPLTKSFVPGSVQAHIVCTIIRLVLDKDGNRVFDWRDKRELMEKVSSKTIQKIYFALSKDVLDPEEMEKN